MSIIVKAGIGEPVTCSGPPQPVAPAFLSAPYAGYAEIASFFDHDLPDYAVDGTLITASGLVARSSDGVASGLPSYWSPALRQYISYDGHNGYDYDISYQPVLAAADGRVTYADWESSDPYAGYGQMIVIRHESGYMTLYGHLSKILVNVGQRVRAGQEIAISGTTGHSTGPHLHFSVFHNCHVVDPYGWTGRGPDPLRAFEGETSTYLWRKGEAPLILNPLPNWPDFGSGHLPAYRGHASAPSSVTHLLLLKVPQTARGASDVALAAFQQQLSSEHEQLFALLNILKQEGLVQSYSLVAHAAAIRVQGTASAQELIGLPGVASILGNRTKDLARANIGLAHALNEATGSQSDLSLFPSSYLDGQWDWRLSVSVEEGGSYVLGHGWPGSTVHASLYRHGKQIGSDTARAESGDGAFALSLTGPRSAPDSIRVGDTVSVSCRGKSTSVLVARLSVYSTADGRGVAGRAPAGAEVQVTVADSVTGGDTTAQAHAGGPGRAAGYRVRLGAQLAAGDILVTSLPDVSGNTIFSWSRATGFSFIEGTSSIHGWVHPGSKWTATVFRRRQVQARGSAITGSDGYLSLSLTRHGARPYGLRPGDLVLLARGGRAHRVHSTWIHLPHLGGNLAPGSRTFVGQGPSRTLLYLRVWDDASGQWTVDTVRTQADGRYAATLPHPVILGDAADVISVGPGATMTEQEWAMRGVVLHLGTSLVTGRAVPGETLVLRVASRRGRVIGLGTATADPRSGAFAAEVQGLDGQQVALHPRDNVLVTDGDVTTYYHPVRLALTLGRQGETVRGRVHGHGIVSLVVFHAGREVGQLTAPLAPTGAFRASLRDVYPLAAGDRVEALYGSATRGATCVSVTMGGGLVRRLVAFDRALHVLSWAGDGLGQESPAPRAVPQVQRRLASAASSRAEWPTEQAGEQALHVFGSWRGSGDQARSAGSEIAPVDSAHSRRM